MGRLLRGRSPREKPPLTGEVAAKQAGGALGLAAGCPLAGGDAKPVKAPQASQARPAPHCVGRLFARAEPAGKASPSGEVAAKQAGGVPEVSGGGNAPGGMNPSPTDGLLTEAGR